MTAPQRSAAPLYSPRMIEAAVALHKELPVMRYGNQRTIIRQQSLFQDIL